jgi:hypothetical protein
MMRRLREEVASADPIVARAAKLVESAQPLAPSDAMRRRVLASVVRERLSFAMRRRWVARPAAFVAVLLGTAVAAASFQKAWLPRAYQLVVQRSWSSALPYGGIGTDKHHSVSSRSSHVAKDPLPPAPSDTEFTPGGEAAPTFDPAPGEALVVLDEIGIAPHPRDDVKMAKRGVPRRRTAAPPAKVEVDAQLHPSDGASLVLLAIKVLRRAHDAVQASQLLEEYLRTYPRGALREEAMALAVEAAAARGDRRESLRLAARYERSFPDGRFGQLLRPR